MAQRERTRKQSLTVTLGQETVGQLRRWASDLGISVSALVEIIVRTCGQEVVVRIRQRGP